MEEGPPGHHPVLHTAPYLQCELRQLPTLAKELLAGGVAGGLSKTSVAPLERIKILFQTGQLQGSGVGATLRRIHRTEGAVALFRGNGASVLRIVPYAAIHFTAYESYRKGIVQLASQASPTQPVSPLIDLLAGSGAGASAVMITYPLDLVRTRLAFQSESGKDHSAEPAAANRASSHASATTSASSQRPVLERLIPRSPSSTIRGVIASTVKQEGFLGLYRGIGPTLAGILPYAGLKFYVYQSLKQYYWRQQQEADSLGPTIHQKLPVPVMLTFGACSGLVAQTLTYPLDVVRRRMQVQGLKLPPAQQQAALKAQGTTVLRSTWHGLVTIGTQQGVKALFAGLTINYMKVVPSTAIGFTLYDTMKSYLDLPNNL
ncbi:hypothetical protein ABBQ32_007532 [Trebouxia sp. C0010 RCD-2024]